MAELQVSSLVDLDHLQTVQQRFAEATGLAIIAVNSRGTPVTEACHFTEFCQRMRADPVRRQLCYGCDAHGGLQAAIKKRPHIYQCHAGLVDFSIPITTGDVYIGAILCGQVRIEKRTAVLDHVMMADESWQDDPELRDLHDANRATTLRQVEAAAETLWDVLKEFDGGAAGQTVTLPAAPAPPPRPPRLEPSRPNAPSLREPGSIALPESGQTFWTECDGEDLPAAFERLDEAIDEIWTAPTGLRAVAFERLEDSVVEVARSLCPDAVDHLRYRILKQRAHRGAALGRYQAQAIAEALLLVVFDGIRRLRPRRQRDFQDLLNEIERHRAKGYSLTEAAAFLSLSPGHLSKKFKAVTGTSFLSYVMARRLRRACLLLAHTDLSVVKVAAELGFRQANYFARVFRAETGLSPSEFRREAAARGSWHRTAVSCRD